MQIRLKGRRIPGNDTVTFKNPEGDTIVLKNIGDVSQHISQQVACDLCSQYGDIIEIVTLQASAPENKSVQPKMLKNKRASEEAPLDPPAIL